MLQYAGVDLLTPDSAGWLDSYLQRTDLDRLDLFGASPVALCDQRTQAVGSHQPVTPYPIPNYRKSPQLELNQLYWPSGAARWSTFIGLVDSAGLDEIRKTLKPRTELGTTSTLVAPQLLTIADSHFQGAIGPRNLIDSEGRFAITTAMYMLEPRAVSTVKGNETLWLLPLVDVRYHWQNRRLPHRVPASLIASRTTETNVLETWDGWLALLNEALDEDVEFKPAAVQTDYFYPDRTELNQSQHNAAIALDALAHSCGRRFVRRYNGVCELIDPTESLSRHAAQLSDNTGGGMVIMTQSTVSDVDAFSAARPPLAKMAIYPEFVDVVYRKLVEFDSDDVPDDMPNSDVPMPAAYANASVLAGTGTRAIRNKSMAKQARNIVTGTSQVVYTPSWVGLHLWQDGTGDCPEPAGTIDTDFYGDRYFRLAEQITEDVVAWKAQQHEYDYAGFLPWNMTGFDDHIIWDHNRGSTHIKSHGNDFGVSTQLVQVHRQCTFDPNMIVGVISSAWTLYPDDPPGESCTLEIETDGTPTVDTLPGDIADVFDYTWQWAECFARPFIPTDPWAATDSIQYGRTMVWAGAEVVAVTRSQSIIEDLRDRVLAPDSVLGAAADDRLIVSDNASGVVYLRRYGCEWQTIWIDCAI